MVVDALGRVAEIGQQVAFGEANKGAHPLRIGTIVKVSDKTVTVEYERAPARWGRRDLGMIKDTARRGSGAFVQVQS
ncbi:hypothetical protein KPPK1081_29 [Klebsiella phage KPPK108.1]|uniref:Uncharacterized protein n=1 Tax=Klebsiella phage KPPK108.1 TaxID=2894584 RepID=A0AAE9C6W1_9CAUD|nr:hypothetical protein KPPK1081_29 [Klebsiella phage KPPK108.1]WPH66234.1 hypothetical protein NKA196_orf028 [Klebsiella phage NKA196]